MGSQPVLFSLLPGLAGVWHIHTYRHFCWRKLTLSAWRIYCEQAWLTRGHAETPPPGFIITPASRCRKIDFQFFDGARLRTLLNAFMQCNTQQVIPFGKCLESPCRVVWSMNIAICAPLVIKVQASLLRSSHDPSDCIANTRWRWSIFIYSPSYLTELLSVYSIDLLIMLWIYIRQNAYLHSPRSDLPLIFHISV